MQTKHAGVTVKVVAGDQHRPDAAAAVRRGQPAGPHRQLRCRHASASPRSASQLEDLTDVISAEQLRGHEDRATPSIGGVPEPGTFDGKFAAAQLRPHRLRALVLGVAVRGRTAGPCRRRGTRRTSSASRPRPRASTCSSGARRRRPTTRRWPSPRRSRRAATRSGWRWRTSSRTAGRSRPCRPCFTGMKKIIDAGYFKPGGAGTQFTAAQAQWSNDEDAILYPSGGWIENEMKTQTKDGLQDDRGARAHGRPRARRCPYEALHTTAGEAFIVPAQGKNVAGGKEFLRAMLSKEAATNFAKTTLRPTIVKGTVPEDGFGSTALRVAGRRCSSAAGDQRLLLELRRPLRHEHGPARRSGTRSCRRSRRRRPDQGPAGDHRQGRRTTAR